MRTLVTAKWSARADREKQFVVDFNDYVAAESDGKPFHYVFVTNEFDPARLMRACEKLAVNAPMFTHVVHISTDAVRATYGKPEEPSMSTAWVTWAQSPIRRSSMRQFLASSSGA
jgi:hypothetical protein